MLVYVITCGNTGSVMFSSLGAVEAYCALYYLYIVLSKEVQCQHCRGLSNPNCWMSPNYCAFIKINFSIKCFVFMLFCLFNTCSKCFNNKEVQVTVLFKTKWDKLLTNFYIIWKRGYNFAKVKTYTCRLTNWRNPTDSKIITACSSPFMFSTKVSFHSIHHSLWVDLLW